jgi:hypothetical protein
MIGETKVRPGTYFNIQKKGDGAAAGATNGITGVLFKSDWGPLNEAVEVSIDDGYEKTYGTDGTTDAIGLAFEGGAVTAICCRNGVLRRSDSEEILQGSERRNPGECKTEAGRWKR